MKKMVHFSRYLTLGALSASLFVGSGAAQASPNNNLPQTGQFAAQSFANTWERTDMLVEQGQVQRSYYWGPQPNSGGIMEDYAQGVNGKRLVQYFDKSRMEINNPGGNPNDPFYVTNGLLTIELISGRMQVGNGSYVNRAPADIPLASDTDDPNAPTYVSFQGVSNTTLGDHFAPNRVGQFATATINRTGLVSSDASKASVAGTRFAYFEPSTNHNIPEVVWDFLNLSGPIYNTSMQNTQESQLSVPWYYTTGLPISEPYWAKVKIANQPNVDVMIQAFERRVVTYVPSAPDGYKVQMSNIGQHYFNWRYGNTPPATSVPTDPTQSPSQPTATQGPSQDTPVPTATTQPPSQGTPVPTATAQPQHSAAEFDGTWVIDNRLISLEDHILKMRISHSGNNITVQGFDNCDTGLCSVDTKTKAYAGQALELTLGGISLKITLTNQGTKLNVVEYANEEYLFHQVKFSDFDGVWLSENANANIAKLVITSKNGKVTVTRFDDCGQHLCEKETKTVTYSDEPITLTLNGDTFKISVDNTGLEVDRIKVGFNDTANPLFSKVTPDSFDGTWLSNPQGLRFVITHTNNTIHIHSFIGLCIDTPCGPIPDYHNDVQYTGEPLTFTINPHGDTFKLSFDNAAGTKIKAVTSYPHVTPWTTYFDKAP